ncbi:MAG: tannase/feruloyl esterase family alpha/beta hydrolase [Deltaproteobacteria bacterium]|nr:MAG: tannase/feruloyl esterase family alpha/beta hydrolase [Deltaproteobacteria bacterium]TMB40882.1 MAG: tannase/feruloyl esterase family alpha/beta hydrolase [Deltaproteobacteria bacterium]
MGGPPNLAQCRSRWEDRMTGHRFRISIVRFIASYFIAVAIAAFATSARAQANIDVDERRTTPVPHRYIHGILGDAKFQIALPDNWNGEFAMGARGFSGDENASGAFKTVGLQKGYAYALSDQGWNRFTIIDQPEDKYYESRRRILQLTQYTKALISRYYGKPARRTFMVGGSNGGHNTKMMVEDYPEEYDGGLAGYGITSHIEWMGSNTRFVRNFDVIASRIDDIIAKRTARPNWDPATTPLSPPLTPDQLQALLNIYNMPAHVGGLAFNIGRVPGSEYRWPPASAKWPLGSYTAILGYATTSVAKFDRFYDPNGDGVLSLDEIKAWDPNLSPPPVANDLRRFDNTGDLQHPIIIGHGSHDPIVSPGETLVYKRLVEARFGVAGARKLLAVYFIPGMGHGGAEYDAALPAMFNALEAWVDYRESGGRTGSPPPNVLVGGLGSYPRN